MKQQDEAQHKGNQGTLGNVADGGPKSRGMVEGARANDAPPHPHTGMHAEGGSAWTESHPTGFTEDKDMSAAYKGEYAKKPTK